MMRTSIKACWLCLLTLVVLCTNGVAAQAQTLLRYKFKEGEKLNYALEQKMTMAMKVQGNDVEIKADQTIDMSWKVLAASADGTVKMTQTFDRLRFKMTGPMVDFDYDSKDGKDPEGPIGTVIGPAFKALAGAEFAVTMNARGQYSDVKVPEKLKDALQNLPGAAGLGETFSEAGLKHMIEQSGVVLPEKAVSKGQSWTTNTSFKVATLDMKVDNTLTAEGSEKRGERTLEKISLKPKLTLGDGPGPGGATIKLKSQDSKGIAYFDAAAGRLRKLEMDQDMEMEISAGGQDITQKLKQTVTMKLADK